jgi:glycosyltransferase involved in cell wall biosynthesis
VSYYPDRWHPCYFLADALTAMGAHAEVIRNADTLNCWGLRVNGKLMVWLIDNRHEWEKKNEDPAAQELLSRGVLVCHAQLPDCERVGGKWLPLAASPGFRPLPSVSKRYDVVMVGYIRDPMRAMLLADIAGRFNLGLAQGLFGENAVSMYNAGRCGVNIPTHWGEETSYDSANMRLFEVLACGIPLVTPYEPYMSALGLEEGKTAFFYRNRYDLPQAVDCALQCPDVGEAGRVLVEARHTYEARARQVLEWLA